MGNSAQKIMVGAATAALIFVNWLSTTGAIGGVTPEVVSGRYETLITPAGYAFAIWGVIYLGVIAFTIAQFFPGAGSRLKDIRIPFVFTCIANITWIFLWHNSLIGSSVAAILSLLGFLAILNFSFSDDAPVWTRAIFGIYFGWVTAASIVNIRIALMAAGYIFDPATDLRLAFGLIAAAGLIGVLVNFKLKNAAYPLAIGWAVAAIAVKQSGNKTIAIAAAVALIALTASALSFIFQKPKTA